MWDRAEMEKGGKLSVPERAHVLSIFNDSPRQSRRLGIASTPALQETVSSPRCTSPRDRGLRQGRGDHRVAEEGGQEAGGQPEGGNKSKETAQSDLRLESAAQLLG